MRKKSYPLLSGFCHFCLVSFMGFVTEPWHSRYVLFLCECAASSVLEHSSLCALFCVGAWFSDPGTRVLSFGFVTGFGHSSHQPVWPMLRPTRVLSTTSDILKPTFMRWKSSRSRLVTDDVINEQISLELWQTTCAQLWNMTQGCPHDYAHITAYFDQFFSLWVVIFLTDSCSF